MANGGGYRYGLQSTGAVAPVSMEGTEHVAIVEEDLNIDLWSQRAAVMVNYKLLNTTNRAVKVVFGFPCDETKSNGGWPVPASAQSGNGLTGYNVESAGKPIKSLEQNQPWGDNGAPGTGGDVLKGIGGG